MKIAIVGAGAVGSTFAFKLARAGHDVTVVGRGERLEQLRRDGAIVTVDGERAGVRVRESLDAETPWDLVLVTVLASQVDAVLPALARSAARAVMFMFNTFESLARLRDAVGAERFAFGFPAVIARLEEGRLQARVVTVGQITTVTDAAWAKVFTDAGIGSVAHDDMQSWLRTHAAFIVPVMVLGSVVHARRAGVSWGEAMRFARAMREGFALVRGLGNAITPGGVVALSRAPSVLVGGAFWVLSRLPMARQLGAHGAREAHSLLAEMTAADPVAGARLRERLFPA